MTADNILVLWNEGEFASLLEQSFGAGNVVTSTEQLLAAIPGKERVVVLAELNWGDKRLGDLYGVTVARKILRAQLKLRVPILFVSFLSYRQLRLDAAGNEVLDRRIAGAVGHAYLRLPASPELWKARLTEMQPLADMQFADVFNSFCGVKGLIDDVIHQLENRCRELFSTQPANAGSNLQELIGKAFEGITSLLGQTPESRAVNRTAQSFSFATATENSVLRFLDSSKRSFKELVTDEQATRTSTVPTKLLPWKALLLDDEPGGSKAILEALKTRGIDCVQAQTVAEAEQKIEEDRNNELTVAIADYRLLETFDGTTRHQPLQGYDFLVSLAKSSRFMRLIALSGLSKSFLLESFRKYNARVEVFSKNDLRDQGAINLFADNVAEVGTEAYDALCSQPEEAAEWEVLKPFYMAHRQAVDYDEAEQRISRATRERALQIDRLLKLRDKEALLSTQLPKFENLQKRMDLPDAEEERSKRLETLMPIFRTKLAARRLAIWLKMALGFDAGRIFLVLTGELSAERTLEQIKAKLREEAGEKRNKKNSPSKKKKTDWATTIDRDAEAELENRAKQPFSHLALQLSELPQGLLIEEQNWLRYDMGRELMNLDTFDQSYYWFQLAAEEWCLHNSELAKDLAQRSNLMGADGVPAIQSLADGKAFFMAVRDLLGHEKDGDFDNLLNHLQTAFGSDGLGSSTPEEIIRLLKQ